MPESELAATPRDTYTHGHHQSVVQSHARRTVEVEGAFALPELRSGMRLLDAGCGPGTITVGLARAVAPAEVVGIDLSEEVLAIAREQALAEGVDNLHFRIDDIYGLDCADSAFDVVFAHQLLQHLTDPVRALREMRRVLRPGGLVAVRDSDYATMSPAPKFPEFDEWLSLYHAVAYANDAEPDAGRYMSGWVRAAGFSDVRLRPNVVAYEGEDARVWGRTWSQRILHSSVGAQAVQYGIAEPTDLTRISEGWRRFAESESPFFMYAQMGILASA